jgi:hypothetical protein
MQAWLSMVRRSIAANQVNYAARLRDGQFWAAGASPISDQYEVVSTTA